MILQQDSCEVQLKNKTSVNLDKTFSWTLNHAFSTENSDANGAVEASSNDLHLEGSPQMPDLLTCRSPRLTQERKGILPPKHKTGNPIPSSTPGIKDRLAFPAVSPKLQKEAIEEKAFGSSEQLISNTKHEAEHSRPRDQSYLAVAGGGNPCNDFRHSEKHEVLAMTTVIEPPALDGILNQCALPFVGRTRETQDRSEKDQNGPAINMYASTTGTSKITPWLYAQAIAMLRILSF